MPLVRIDVVEGRRTPDGLHRLADTVQREDWSFGLGRAQFLEGDL
jgi:hypothetical protein